MRVIVFGAKGMLGRYVCEYLRSKDLIVIEHSRKTLDIYKKFTEGTLFSDLVSMVQHGDWIINCAGITNKRPEIGTVEMYVLNSLFPMFLDRIPNVNLIHISTDCVFSGSEGNYTVSDVPDETNPYGMSKGFGERLKQSLVIRTSIIGEDHTEHSSGLLNWVLSQQGVVNGYTNHLWNGVTCLELAKIIYINWICDHRIEHGIVNVTSPYPVTKYSLVKTIGEIYDVDMKVQPFEAVQTIDKTLVSTIQSCLFISEQIIETREFDMTLFKTQTQITKCQPQST